MSDNVETEGKGKKRDNDRTGAERPSAEPVIIDQSLFDFLEGLFMDQPAAMPERLELRLIYGARRDKYGPVIDTIRFAPANASPEILKRSAGRALPSKEGIVGYSNKILARLRQECDESRKAGIYGVLAWNILSSDEPYARWSKHFDPKGRYSKNNGEEDDEEQSDEKKIVVQVLRHQEKMLEQVSDAFAGIMDRQDRMNARLIEQNDRHMARTEKLFDLTERIMQAEAKRKSENAWDEIRQDAAKRGLNLVSSIAPPLVGMLVSKPGSAAANEVELKALREFFKTTEEGGRLTEEQAQAAFGNFNPDTGELITPGVLSKEQTAILWAVTKGDLPTSDLDKLVPGGQFAISTDQFMQLMQVIPIDQLLPLRVIFDNHTKKTS